MKYIGTAPIPLPLLICGKLAAAGCAVFVLLNISNAGTLFESHPITAPIGIALAVVGTLLMFVAIAHLGESIAVGIPTYKTNLKTGGVYTFTRNPIYLGGILMCAGSCLFVGHLANYLMFAVAVAVHHAIVLKEEEFLRKEFGEEWQAYRQRVPRYLGLIRRAPPTHTPKERDLS